MEDQLKKITYYATLAPSGHNTQPWKFSIKGNSFKIYPDYSRRLQVVDPDNHALFISLGCALENLTIAANHMGYGSNIEYFPADEEKDCIRITINKEKNEIDPDLFNAIPNRQATRNKYDGQQIPPEDWEQLKQVSRQDKVSFIVFREQNEIDPIIEFVKEGNVLQFRNKLFVNELINWIRFSKKKALASRDGLNSAAMGLPYVPTWFGEFILHNLATPKGEANKCEKLIRGSSGLILFIAESNDRTSWINVGRSFERVALKAASLNIKHAHMNMPCEELEIRAKLKNHLGLKNGEPLLLLRLGYSNPRPKTYRRPVEEIMV